MKPIILFIVLASVAHSQSQPSWKKKDPSKSASGEAVQATPEMIQEECLRVAKKCDFAISYTLPGQLTGTPLSPEEAQSYLPQFFAAIDIFPVRFIKETKLNTVVFCRDLKLRGMAAGGVACGNTICLKVPFQSHVIYHEMFHVADPVRENNDWTKLNHRKFVYGGNLYNPIALDARDRARMESSKKNTDQMKDFVSEYATTSETEDRAETFARMVSHPKDFLTLAQASPVLTKKAERIKAIIRDFAPAMNRDFWSFIATSDDATRRDDFQLRASINAQRKKEKKALLNSGYQKKS